MFFSQNVEASSLNLLLNPIFVKATYSTLFTFFMHCLHCSEIQGEENHCHYEAIFVWRSTSLSNVPDTPQNIQKCCKASSLKGGNGRSKNVVEDSERMGCSDTNPDHRVGSNLCNFAQRGENTCQLNVIRQS